MQKQNNLDEVCINRLKAKDFAQPKYRFVSKQEILVIAFCVLAAVCAAAVEINKL